MKTVIKPETKEKIKKAFRMAGIITAWAAAPVACTVFQFLSPLPGDIPMPLIETVTFGTYLKGMGILSSLGGMAIGVSEAKEVEKNRERTKVSEEKTRKLCNSLNALSFYGRRGYTMV